MSIRRRAFTLVELIVVLTVLSVVWLSVTSVLYTLYRADRRLRDDLQRENAFDRFAMRLRLDAHEASSAALLELAGGGHELVLAMHDERTIHYALRDRRVDRFVRNGAAVLHRDSFLVGQAGGDWKFDAPESPSLIVLALTIQDQRSEAVRVRQIKTAIAPVKAPVRAAAETSS